MSDPRITRLKTPEECEQFARNVEAAHPDLARKGRRHAVTLRALKYGEATEVEREALQCIYAFEEARYQQTGKRTRASRIWQSISRNGILPTVDKSVAKGKETEGYDWLVAAGLEDLTFEAVVLKYPTEFSPAAVAQAKIKFATTTDA